MSRPQLTSTTGPAQLAVAAIDTAPSAVVPRARLILIRAAADSGAEARILALCATHGLPPEAANVASRTGEGAIIAVEVPSSLAAAGGMLEAQLRATAGVEDVTVTHIGAPARPGIVQHRV